MFDESPSMCIDTSLSGAEALFVDATYAKPGVRAFDPSGFDAIKSLGEKMDTLIGSAAVIRADATLEAGDCACASTRGRVVLIGPHFELTEGIAKRRTVVRAVAWATGQDPSCGGVAERSQMICAVCEGTGVLLSKSCPLCSEV